MMKHFPPLLLAATVLTARAGLFETSIAPRPDDKFTAAMYRIWVPDGVKTLRAVIVKQHGCGRNGVTHANDVQWQELARRHDAALLGTYLPTGQNCADWFQPDNGSGHAFLAALTNLAQTTGHPELTRLPWAIWGHSGGAYWAVFMAERYPERVAAVFAQSGGTAGTNSPARDVPILFNRGVQDFTNIIRSVEQSFRNNRPIGAPWAVSINPKAKHECGQSRQLAIPYFDELLAQRLPIQAGRATLRSVIPARGWLADAESAEIGPVGEFHGEATRASWLPSEKLARRWREFVHTGRIEDRSPPAPPQAVKCVVGSATVTLSWQAEADLESGLKTFVVYRDGEKIGQYEGVKTNYAKGNFQAGNYGDEAEPAEPEIKFVDRQAAAGKHRYQVTAVNWQDLESEKSRAVIATMR